MGALLWLRPVQIDASGGVFGAFFSPRWKCSFMPGLSVISGSFRLLGRFSRGPQDEYSLARSREAIDSGVLPLLLE
jgi:hypothetical protein